MGEPRNFSLRCPECDGHLVIDSATGEVLAHRPAKKPLAGGKDFDTLLEDLDKDKAEAEEVFEREVAAMKDRDRLLEEKFQQALKRAEEETDDGPFPRPIDLD
jgi:hypothetical protein